jgi:hypothetical protein
MSLACDGAFLAKFAFAFKLGDIHCKPKKLLIFIGRRCFLVDAETYFLLDTYKG